MKTWTTGQAARAAKISRASLQEWIRLGKISAPPVQVVGGKAVRMWRARDIERLRAAKSKIYGTGKGKRRVRR